MEKKTAFKAIVLALGAAALLAACELIGSGDPTSLSATDGEQEITISWSEPSFPEGEEKEVYLYHLYRDGAPLTQTSGTSYADNTFTSGIEYDYYVYAEFTDLSFSDQSNTDAGYGVKATALQMGEGAGQYPEQADAEGTGAWFSILVQEGWPYSFWNNGNGDLQLFRKGEDISAPDVILGAPTPVVTWTGEETGVYFVNAYNGISPYTVSVWHH